jgi:hypothetical protein
MHPFMAFFKPNHQSRTSTNHHQAWSIAIDVEEVYKQNVQKLSSSNLNDKTYYQ